MCSLNYFTRHKIQQQQLFGGGVEVWDVHICVGTGVEARDPWQLLVLRSCPSGFLNSLSLGPGAHPVG